jgi:hypothetical protein
MTTTLYRTIRQGREDSVVRLEWYACSIRSGISLTKTVSIPGIRARNGGYGRVTIGRLWLFLSVCRHHLLIPLFVERAPHSRDDRPTAS